MMSTLWGLYLFNMLMETQISGMDERRWRPDASQLTAFID